MRTVFVDTSYLLALVLRGDQHHAAALAIETSFFGRLLTTDFVLVECCDALSRASTRAAANALCDRVLFDPSVTVISASRGLVEQGRELYASRLDKDWSLTDCISFLVMREQGLTDALTADHHFEQAGFRALLRDR